MKKKLLLITLFLTAFVKNASSQEYIPMLDSSWNIAEANFGGTTTYIVGPGEDVVIGGYTYKKFLDKTTEVYLREDITQRKVYKRINGVDKLLYDFSLENNSIITLENGVTYTVTVSTVNVVGGTRKKIRLYNDWMPSEIWVEGVGSTFTPMKPSYELFSDPYIYLHCSSVNNINVYNHGVANGQAVPTDCSMLLDREEIMNIQKVSFYPNPFKSTFKVATETYLENASLKIFNSIGQLVKETKNIIGKEYIFYRDDLRSGIYLVQLYEGHKLVTTTKMIIAD